MHQTVFRHRWLPAWRGALAILFGLLAIFWPGITLLSMASLFTVFTLVNGAAWVVAGVRNRAEDKRCWAFYCSVCLGSALVPRRCCIRP